MIIATPVVLEEWMTVVEHLEGLLAKICTTEADNDAAVIVAPRSPEQSVVGS
ncbi:hypothetical protein [Streptomyces sp. NPDC060187]|uniref:hypothetical protein n=1 Tax=Streptomyces sp. NPDC060187 TaxID=3347067 RepID=UPI00365F472C